MKHKKEMFIILLIAFLLVGLGTLAASDVTKNDTITTKNSDKNTKIETHDIKDTTKTQPHEKQIQKTQKLNKKRDTEPININNYDELANALNDGTEPTKILNINDNIMLDGNPTLNLTITNLTINGNQKTINGTGQYQFLKINTGQTVTINNMIITNCKADIGGAIDNYYGTLNINNTNLTGNTATNGGAIDNYYGTVNINNTNLQYNNASRDGGAVINDGGNLSIINSNLSYNRADNGAAMHNAGNLTVIGSNFTNNTAGLNGGVLSNVRSCKVSYSLFYNNNPANFIIDENNHIQLVDTDDFISVGDFTIITDYKVYHGSGLEELGKIMILREAPNVKLLLNGTNTSDNTFIIRGTPEKLVPVNISNYNELKDALNDTTQPIKILNITADITLGGNPKLNSSIKTLIINGNLHTINGRQTYHFLSIDKGQNAIINNLTIIRCDLYYYDGGAVTNEGNLSIIDSILNNNTASEGGAIANIYEGNMTIINTTLNYNNASAYGGAILTDGNTTVIDSNLNYNGAGFDGGAVYNYRPRTINITNSNLTHNSAGNGGVILNYGNVIISDSYIAYNKANSEGGTIKNDGSCKISDTTFFQNTPENFIINGTKKIQLIRADNFINVGDFRLIIDDQTYQGNGAEELGQYTIPSKASTVKLILNGTDTTDNAFYLKGTPGPINIKNYEELASALNNGAESIKTLNITANIVLKGNLTVNSSITSLTIIGNQKIIDGNSSYQFLKISNGQDVIINNLTVTNCSSAYDGGAIDNEGILTIINCNLTNNKADDDGGAIHNNEGNLTIIESNINYNNAHNAGAIYNYGGLMTIEYSNITHNKANSKHGALYNNGRYNISDTFFYNNTPANFIIDENNHIQLANADSFISINDFIIINDYQVYQGTGRNVLEQYTVPREATNVKLLLNGTSTTDNIFIIKGDDEIINSQKTRITNENPTSGSTTDIMATFIIDDNPITNGMVIFRLNGKTLRDDEGKVIYVKLTEGTAILENVPITNAWVGEETTLQAIFVGNDEYEPMYTDKLIFSVSNREAQMEIRAPSTAQRGDTITLSASVTAGGEPVTTGRVAFKLNGKTLKDETGKALYVNVDNGVANITYTLPAKTKDKTYTLTAVFADNSYKRCEKETQITVTR